MELSSVLERPASAAPPARGGTGGDPIGRRVPARLLVVVDGSASSTRQLVWALQEAARREAFVLAVAVLDAGADDDVRAATAALVDAQLLHAVGQTGVHGRARAALLDPAVVEALTGAAGGTELVVVHPHRTTVLRPAVPRQLARRTLVRHG
jgi:hypothetical protein